MCEKKKKYSNSLRHFLGLGLMNLVQVLKVGILVYINYGVLNIERNIFGFHSELGPEGLKLNNVITGNIN